MPYRNKQMLRDANGDLIPQYWDVAAGDFKPLTGSDGANDTRLTGSIVEVENVLPGVNTKITPGSSVDLLSLEVRQDIKKLSIAFSLGTRHPISISIGYYTWATVESTFVWDKIYKEEIRRGIATCDLKGNYYKVIVTNDGADEITLNNARVVGFN